MDEKKEVKMNPTEAERVRGQVGLTPEEVGEINEPRESKSPPAVRRPADSFGGRGKSKINAAANVLAAGLTAVAGVGLEATVEGALRSTPSARVEEVKPDPKRDIPPEGITFPQDTGRKDGGVVEPVLEKRVFLPNVTKEAMVRYHLPRIGNLKEDGITINHAGTLMNPEVGFELVDYELYKQTLGRLAKVCRPNGIEWFIYNARSGDTMGPEPSYPLLYKGYNQIVTYLSYVGLGRGFLQNSTLLIGRRPDGVTEVHWGLFLKPGAQPTAEDFYNTSWSLITDDINGFIASDDGNSDRVSEECRTTKRSVFELLYERGKDRRPFPIQLTIK